MQGSSKFIVSGPTAVLDITKIGIYFRHRITEFKFMALMYDPLRVFVESLEFWQMNYIVLYYILQGRWQGRDSTVWSYHSPGSNDS